MMKALHQILARLKRDAEDHPTAPASAVEDLLLVIDGMNDRIIPLEKRVTILDQVVSDDDDCLTRLKTLNREAGLDDDFYLSVKERLYD